ncbi:MAG: PRC-barrel domain-containing protein [bacterium]
MIKKSSELIGKPVILQREKAVVGLVKSFVIDPETGELVGLLVLEGFGSRNLKSLAIKDVTTITKEYFLIGSYENLGELDEIVRIKKVLDKKIGINKCNVYTVSGKFLGRVKDFSINLTFMRLEKIFVDSLWIISTARHYIISFNQIISIEPGKIIVEDATVSKKKSVLEEVAEAS